MRRLSWAPINFPRWVNFALTLQELGVDLSLSLGAAIGSMKVSWERLGDGLDELFQPSGTLGTHAAHHYHGPVDPDVRARVLAAVAADYECSLMYLDVALQLSVEALNEVGALSHSSWKKLVRAAESRLVHSVMQEIRVDAVVGRDIDPKMALNWLGAGSCVVDDWKALNRLRETFGFLLPGANEIGPRVDEMVSHFITAVPPSDLKDVVFALRTGISHPSMADGENVVAPSPKKVSRREYEARLDAGVTAGEAGNHEEAARIFRECVADDPEDGSAHFLLAQALAALGDPAEALEHLYNAQAIGGADPGAIQRKLITSHFNVASGAFNKKDYRLAIDHYSRAFHLDRSDVEVRRHLMEALGAHGELDAALWHAGILLRDHRERTLMSNWT